MLVSTMTQLRATFLKLKKPLHVIWRASAPFSSRG